MPGTEAETVKRISEKPEPSLLRRVGGSGYFITLEGVEGSGKSSQIIRLAGRIERTGREVVVTREPGGTAIGRSLRDILLGEETTDLDPLAELMLYAADRAQHIVEVIEPALQRGAIVLSDRFLDASLAYQGYGRGLGCEIILDLHKRPPLDCRPTRTVLLDMDPSTSLLRARERNDSLGTTAAEGRFEMEDIAFHHRVRHGYLALAEAEPERFRVVDAEGTPGVVEARVWEAVRDLTEAVH